MFGHDTDRLVLQFNYAPQVLSAFYIYATYQNWPVALMTVLTACSVQIFRNSDKILLSFPLSQNFCWKMPFSAACSMKEEIFSL